MKWELARSPNIEATFKCELRNGRKSLETKEQKALKTWACGNPYLCWAPSASVYRYLYHRDEDCLDLFLHQLCHRRLHKAWRDSGRGHQKTCFAVSLPWEFKYYFRANRERHHNPFEFEFSFRAFTYTLMVIYYNDHYSSKNHKKPHLRRDFNKFTTEWIWNVLCTRLSLGLEER